MLASAASPGHRLREQWVQVIGGLASACDRLKSTYGGPRSAAERSLQSAKSGRRSGGRTGSVICSAAAALALGLLDGFLRGLSDLCFAPQVLCASGICHFASLRLQAYEKYAHTL